MTVICNPLSEADELPPYSGPHNNNNNNVTHHIADCSGGGYTTGEYLDGGRLYDNERESDVTFVAGLGGDTWRFPGHRAVLASANQVFRAMLTGPLANDDVIQVPDIDKRAFEQLMRYLYHQPVSLPSVSTARTTLEAANKYICPGLVKTCVIYLDQHLTSSTVLEVFRDLRFFCSRIPTPCTSTEPSAPPLQEDTGEAGQMTDLCDSLMHNCLLFIDDCADEVLKQEAIEELSFEDISIIAPRDTLKVTCELELFNALNRWCISECKRCKKELTSANKRQVLGELSYSVRYLLMSENEFLFGPKASELLDLTECDLIIRRMKGDRSIHFTLQQEELLRKFASPRSNSCLQPVHLSDRSAPRLPDMDNQINSKINAKKNKKQRKKEAKALKKKIKEDEKDSDEKSGCCSCSCFGQGLLRCFVFIFD